jgi:hypothetical protein
MAFKTMDQYNDERYHDKFRLVEDKDSAEVIFLYRSKADELVADAHYIKSSKYSGYVHCCGAGCPACAKGYKIQSKLFVPVYNIKQNDVVRGAIEFWDRSDKFDKQLDRDVFRNYPNPSEFVFKITREGLANDINTHYDIRATFKNTIGDYNTLLSKFNVKMPDHYSVVIREVSAEELSDMLQNPESEASDLPEYVPTPRSGYQSSIPDSYVDISGGVSDAVADVPNIDAATDSTDDELPDPEF